MPIYEYECTSCGHRFEKMGKIGAEAPPCPECAAGVRKLISQSAFILKGGGWYKDHYGLKSDAGGSDTASTAAAAAAAKASGAKTEGGAKSDAPKSGGGATADGGAKSDGAAKSDGGSKPAAAPAATPSTAASK